MWYTKRSIALDLFFVETGFMIVPVRPGIIYNLNPLTYFEAIHEVL